MPRVVEKRTFFAKNHAANHKSKCKRSPYYQLFLVASTLVAESLRSEDLVECEAIHFYAFFHFQIRQNMRLYHVRHNSWSTISGPENFHFLKFCQKFYSNYYAARSREAYFFLRKITLQTTNQNVKGALIINCF